MPTRKLKTHEEIEALVTGEEFKTLPLADKRQRAGQLTAAVNELETTFPALLTQAKSPDERRFLLALVTVEQAPAEAPAPTPAEPAPAAESAPAKPTGQPQAASDEHPTEHA